MQSVEHFIRRIYAVGKERLTPT